MAGDGWRADDVPVFRHREVSGSGVQFAERGIPIP